MNSSAHSLAPVATLLILPLLMGSNGCASRGTGRTVDFVTEVKPVLEFYCLECHNAKSAVNNGGLNLETRQTALSTGRYRPVIRPGRPEESLLFAALRLGHAEALAMPPAPDKVSDEKLAAIRNWIRAGAPWPDGPAGHLNPPR